MSGFTTSREVTPQTLRGEQPVSHLDAGRETGDVPGDPRRHAKSLLEDGGREWNEERLTTGEATIAGFVVAGRTGPALHRDAAANRDILALRITDRTTQPFLRTRFSEGAPRSPLMGAGSPISPTSPAVRRSYVQPYPGPGGKWQISTDGGTEPVWNPNGRELFYRNGNKMMAVDIATRPVFAAG